MRSLLALICFALLASTAQAADPPTRAEIAARAKALGFDQHAQDIARDAAPGARLLPGGDPGVGKTRLGGNPDLPPANKWPRCKGRLLSFLAQMNLPDVAAIAPGALPSTGVLAVFADLHEGSDGVAPIEEVADHVGTDSCVIVRIFHGTLARRATPHGVIRLSNRPARLQPDLVVADPLAAPVLYGFTKDRKADDKWWELFTESVVGRLRHLDPDTDYTPFHQLLGWPSPVQDTPLYGCGKYSKRPSYRLLLQLDYDDSLNFAIGDGGALYISGKPADLRAGRVNRFCAEFQEG